MFEQYQKQFEAMMTPSAWAEQSARAAQQAQELISQGMSAAQDMVKMEMENMGQLALARRPEDVVAAVAGATAKRQAFYAQAAERVAESFKQGQAKWAEMAQAKASEATEQAGQAVDAVFGGAKQGLDFAQSAVKGAVERAGKANSR